MSGHQRIFPDKHALARALAEEFVTRSRAQVVADGRFTIALAGGTTPRLLYEELGGGRRDEVPWAEIQFFWSDERVVPLDHADSNYRLVRETLLAHGRAPAEHVHAMAADPEDPEAGARRYEARLEDVLGSVHPALDWMLLGLGPDGHIASLFPGASTLRESARSVIAVRDSPKPPPVRLTMTLPFINRSAEIHIVVAGAEKAEAVHGTIEAGRDSDRWPAQGIAATRVTWWLDQAAASRLSGR